jgi:8-oxo-dGTP pyrophosphatase MutT (NUDIX family)
MIRQVAHSLKRILFSIYKHLPKLMRWSISYALSSKFLVGMIFFVEKDGRLLLVRHAYQKAWSLPGGWLKKGETIEEGARREIKEEFGASITNIEILKTEAVKSKPVIEIAVGCRFVEPPKADNWKFRGLISLTVALFLQRLFTPTGLTLTNISASGQQSLQQGRPRLAAAHEA